MARVGFRFNPFDYELIDDYLKPEILKNQPPCKFIKHEPVYGEVSSPWSVFNSVDWFRSPGMKETEKCVYVFAKLLKLSKLKSSDWKNTKKRAGCGTWTTKGKVDRIFDCGGKLIGEKRYLVFEVNDVDDVEDGIDLNKVGQYRMHEYSLIEVNPGLNSAGTTTVLCKVTHDSSNVCPINLKSGNKKGVGKVSTSRKDVVHEKEENSYSNVEGTSTVTTESLTVLDSGVGPDVGECSGAVGQSNIEAQELADFCEGFSFDDLGVDFTFDDLGVDFTFDDLGSWDGQSNCNVNCLMECFDDQQQHEPSQEQEQSQDNNNGQLKRKFEYDEDLFQSKKICVDNPN